ncbi:hypothetical protein PC110_g15602 [Phytophthora cactorum]|uniref:M96 mating-specific protein family n=1 Tax=Phytophthora cactorum TaxID=29920 RepID=A0A329RU25_9STRA|nr:hypothetical protein PC113_g6261 [Phytophthora cactorum]KAG2937125.1 hypothetical protein PC115_g4387 [Phytophthora cactorum]KAG3034801.1 hypothetical protein PC119_g4776 [Phytophthora cactorum]KAG3187093.1 hypothetical protein C6341_g3462 [Phytophthora cactorum]RAW28005.1 hypothetical protein PC110_g15602 [Phytophthora cactorum]
MAFFIEEEEDGEVLEAALSFVDDFEGGRPLSPQDLHQRSTLELPALIEDKATSQATKNERRRLLRHAGVYGNPNRARNERRREIAGLRKQLEELQLDLQVLQTRRGGPEARQPSEESTDSAPRLPSMWQQVATQQRRRRNEAEGENARLRLAVQRQQKVADDLKSLLQRKARQLSNECMSLIAVDSPRHHNIVNVLDVRGNLGDFQQLFRHLEAARQEVDVVFAANGLADMVATPSNIHIREGDDGKYLEAFSNKLLAFRLHAVTEALWSHFKSLEKHAGNGSLYQKAEKYIDESNTILEDFTMEMHSNTARADIKVKQIIRRYVETDRDVVIWVSRVSPVQIKHRMLRGLTYHLRGHAIAKRSSASTPRNELSQLQFCSLISFDRETHTMYDHSSVRAALNFLLINTAQKMKVHQDRIENILVEQVLHRQIAEHKQ